MFQSRYSRVNNTSVLVTENQEKLSSAYTEKITTFTGMFPPIAAVEALQIDTASSRN